MTNDERIQRESSLIATIRRKLPEFAKACADNMELVLLHQDAFAADYQEDEYTLLGMAIKHARLRGKEVRVIGKNRIPLAKERKSSEHDSQPLQHTPVRPIFVMTGSSVSFRGGTGLKGSAVFTGASGQGN